MSPFPKTEQELSEAGYTFEGTGKCHGATCKAEIAWYRTPKGKMMPLDEGTLEPHWANCPDVENWRK